MAPEPAEELCQYLQTKLQLAPSFCESLQNDLGFVDTLYEQLESHHEKLQNALNKAFPDEDSLKAPLEQELGVKLDQIPTSGSYANKILNVIEWTASKGYLLGLIAAAHKRNPKNPALNLFVKQDLKQLIEKHLPPVQLPAQPHPTPSANGNDMSVNGRGPVVVGSSAGINEKGIEHIKTGSKYAHLEPGKNPQQEQPIPLPIQTPAQLIDQAYKLIDTAGEAIQLTYDAFQKDGQISDEAIHQVDEAKGKIEQLTSIVENIPAPNHADLHFRLSGEQQYFCEKSRIIVLSIQKAKTQVPSPQFLHKIEEGLKALLQSLQHAKTLIETFAGQVERLNRVNSTLTGTGS